MKHNKLILATLFFLGIIDVLFAGVASIPLTVRHNPQYSIVSETKGDLYTKVEIPKRSTRSYKASVDDVSLNGNLLQVECLVTIGNQQFSVQVDTGSTLLAVPDSSCTTCGNTPDPYLTSPQSDVLTCSDSRCSSLQQCQNFDSCGFKVSYIDGSSIQGNLVSETVSLGGFTTTALVGAVTQSTSKFEAPVADGIIGFAYNNQDLTCAPTCVPPLFDSLVQTNNLDDIFAIYLDYSGGGSLTLGGIDSSLFRGNIFYTNVINRSYYIVNLNSLLVGGTSVVSGSSSFGAAIIDSGTSLTILPVSVYNSFKEYFQRHYSSLPLVTGQDTIWDGSNNCFVDQSITLQYPNIEFVFDGVTVSMPPQNYFVQTIATDNVTPIWCLGLAPGTDNSQTIFGDTFMRGLYIIFDREQNRIGFANTQVTVVDVTGDSSNATPGRDDNSSSSDSSVVQLPLLALLILLGIQALFI
eukprot:TRINITY_DN2001_c0_g1_i1.p1 TRINITY_DN2001_c0_g1~~TRINITY_DN2001_c0_g1_i1.p1  ORF type:complete len:466 (+),score=73.35 TRINITY_DN2001_c0_g1_i1:303-1700(+)